MKMNEYTLKREKQRRELINMNKNTYMPSYCCKYVDGLSQL